MRGRPRRIEPIGTPDVVDERVHHGIDDVIARRGSERPVQRPLQERPQLDHDRLRRELVALDNARMQRRVAVDPVRSPSRHR
jgi:hypothetical protein